MYQYQSIKEEFVSIENKKYTTYGILVACEDNSTSAVENNYIADVFTDYDKAKDFTKLCTAAQLEPIHLLDVLDDIL